MLPMAQRELPRRLVNKDLGVENDCQAFVQDLGLVLVVPTSALNRHHQNRVFLLTGFQ